MKTFKSPLLNKKPSQFWLEYTAKLQERTEIEKFFHYSRAWGLNELIQPESLEDRYYSDGQRAFFAAYENQLLKS